MVRYDTVYRTVHPPLHDEKVPLPLLHSTVPVPVMNYYNCTMIVVETDTLDFLNLRTYWYHVVIYVSLNGVCKSKYGYENELSLSKYFSSILQTDMLYVCDYDDYSGV